MGKKKKSFIDKKKATTFYLVHNDQPDEEGGGDGLPLGGALKRVGGPAPNELGAAAAEPDVLGEYDDYYEDEDEEDELGIPRWARGHEDEHYELSEERRRELIALGFPDDGYDYLRHMRDLGRGRLRHAGPETILEEDEQGLEGFEEDELEEGDEEGLWDEGADREGGSGAGEEDFRLWDGKTLPDGAEAGLAADAALPAAAAAAADAAAGPSTSAAATSGGGRGAAGARSVAGSVRSRMPPPPRGAGTAARSVAGSMRSARTNRSTMTSATSASRASAAGPSVFIAATFVPPNEDVKLVDARRLVAPGRTFDEGQAEAQAAAVTAMTCTIPQLKGKSGKLVQDLNELDASMAALENDDPRRVEVIEGEEWADWLDEFVAGHGEGDEAGQGGEAGHVDGEEEEEEEEEGVSERAPASGPADGRKAGASGRGPGSRRGDGLEDDDDGDDDDEEAGPSGQRDAAGGAAGPRAAVAASVASSYWRPERTDRKQGFEGIDTRFEQLALEYEDEELGELQDEEEEEDDLHGRYADDDGGEGAGARAGAAPGKERARGAMELSDFADVLDEFLDEQRQVDAEEALRQEGLRPLQTHAQEVASAVSQPDAEAIAATKARLERVMMMAAGPAAGPEEQPHYREDKEVVTLQDHQERWDCESVLSLRSNFENHPAKIVEPQSRTGRRGGGTIALSAKTGMPKMPHTALQGGIPEAEEGEEANGGGPAAAAAVPGAAGSGSDDESGEGDDDDADGGLDPTLLVRRKGETAEEKRARKAAVKEARRAQRATKKEVKNMFRQEASKAQRQSAGRSVGTGSTYVIP